MKVYGYGLPNLGNTCYLNSISQALIHTTDFVKYILSDNYSEVYNNKNDFVEVIKALYIFVWNFYENTDELADKIKRYDQLFVKYDIKEQIEKNGKKEFEYVILNAEDKAEVNISKLIFLQKKVLETHTKFFKGYHQEDAGEAFIFIIDSVHKNITYSVSEDDVITVKEPISKYQKLIQQSEKEWYENLKNEYSDLLDIFYGQLQSTTMNVSTREMNIKFEPFSYLNLPIPKNEKRVSIYNCLDLYTEQEDIDNKIIKKVTFFRLPEILVIGYNRFGNGLSKIDTTIDAPLELDMTEYVTRKGLSNKYQLYAVVNHMGSMFGGHYVCNAKKHGYWFNYDDSNISLISESSVISSKNYIMFYKRV